MSGNLRDSALGAAGLCRAYVALRSGDADAARAELGPALAAARRLEARGFFLYVPHIAAELLAAALNFGIDRDWVRHVIRERGLPAPAGAPPDWPWPVRIRALGGFAVDVDGAAADGDNRARGKPVEALRAIVAHGGRRVPLDRLLATVWRGRGRVGADNAGYVTLHRLRKLLGADDALLLVDGQLEPGFRIRLGRPVGPRRCVWRWRTKPMPPGPPVPSSPPTRDRCSATPRSPGRWSARDRLRERIAAACVRGLSRDAGRRGGGIAPARASGRSGPPTPARSHLTRSDADESRSVTPSRVGLDFRRTARRAGSDSTFGAAPASRLKARVRKVESDPALPALRHNDGTDGLRPRPFPAPMQSLWMLAAGLGVSLMGEL